MLLWYTVYNIPTIHTILKKEFDDIIIWIYNDLYDFIYKQKEAKEKRELSTNDFVETLKQLKSQENDF